MTHLILMLNKNIFSSETFFWINPNLILYLYTETFVGIWLLRVYDNVGAHSSIFRFYYGDKIINKVLWAENFRIIRFLKGILLWVFLNGHIKYILSLSTAMNSIYYGSAELWIL